MLIYNGSKKGVLKLFPVTWNLPTFGPHKSVFPYMETFRYFIHMAYNGAAFHGWQSQNNANTIQRETEKALKILLRRDIGIIGAGRTDTGVHARKYFAHFDYPVLLDDIMLQDLKYRLNHLLPDSIAVYQVFRVNNDLHARFSAVSRKYRYYINRNHDPFAIGLSYRLTIPLDLDLMQQGAAEIMLYNDFTCFAKSGTQNKTNLCTIFESYWEERDSYLIYTTSANRFLRNMVRAMVGTLLELGKQKISMAEFRKILSEGSRSDAGQSVPACGLFLEDIVYPEF